MVGVDGSVVALEYIPSTTVVDARRFPSQQEELREKLLSPSPGPCRQGSVARVEWVLQ